jgi:2-amino-4-hydroxy-6-hydroxymethyldihydropteridine diphosphokinase
MPFTETKMNEAYLLTGGNLGNRKQWLARARKSIEENCGKILQASSIYETEPWGNREQTAFLNQAIHISTSLSALQLLQLILEIETLLGRKRDIKYGPRTIDIDILFYNDEIIKTENLVIPHPELENRRFALQCLFDIAPGLVHPVLKKTTAQLLEDCNDPLKVNKIY